MTLKNLQEEGGEEEILKEIADRSGGDFGTPREWSGPWIISPQKLAKYLASLQPTSQKEITN